MSVNDDVEERFRAMYEERYAAVYRYVFRRLGGSREDALDVSSEIFATAWRRRTTVPSAPDDLPWLYGVARRIVARHQRGWQRRHRLMRRLESEAVAHGQQTEESDASNKQRIRSAVLGLTPSDREVLSLLLWEQVNQEEAAQIMGCSANAVAQRFKKAKERLRRQLAPAEARSE
jgi:RNA polymerase sigma-70 factor (ECF subfamily)